MKHSSPNSDRGVSYRSVEMKGSWMSFVTVTAEDKHGVPYSWSGKEFQGEARKRLQEAEHAAAKTFLADPGVRHTAENLDAAYGQHGSESRRQSRRINTNRRKAEQGRWVQRR